MAYTQKQKDKINKMITDHLKYLRSFKIEWKLIKYHGSI